MQQNDIKIEKAVLGALILENDAFIDVQDIIHEDLFYNDFHKATLTAIKSLFAKGTAIDTLTVLNKLKEENVKATAYDVVELTNAIESSANIEHHIYILKVLSYKRKALNIAKTIIRETNENKDIFKVLQDAEHSLLNIDTNTRSTEAQAYKISQEYATELDSYIKGDIEVSINTGLYFIDKKLGGYKPKLYILAARPAMGKTVTMAQILLNISKKGKRVGLFSLEMGKKEITQRLLANVSRVEYSKITNYNLNSQEINNILTESEKLNNYFLIDDKPAITVQYIRGKAIRNKLEFIAIDYLQLMKGEGKSREEIISNISRGLKELQKDLDIPILALAQLSRAVESRADKKPILSDLRESGAIEQDADVVQFLFRPEYYGIMEDAEGISTEDIIEVITSKNRQGATGSDFAEFHKSFMAIANKQEFYF